MPLVTGERFDRGQQHGGHGTSPAARPRQGERVLRLGTARLGLHDGLVCQGERGSREVAACCAAAATGRRMHAEAGAHPFPS